MAITKKQYRCQKCHSKKSIETNHYGQCYSWGSYNKCPCTPPTGCTTWECMETPPPGETIPENWTPAIVSIEKEEAQKAIVTHIRAGVLRIYKK